MDSLRLFSDCDEFCREFLPRLQGDQITADTRPRIGESRVSVSEVRTLLLRANASQCQTGNEGNDFANLLFTHDFSAWLHVPCSRSEAGGKRSRSSFVGRKDFGP